MMKIEIAYTLSSDVEKILICKNKQPNQNPNSRDVGIVEFLPKVHRTVITETEKQPSKNHEQTKVSVILSNNKELQLQTRSKYSLSPFHFP